MIKKILFICLFFCFFNPLNAALKEQIILNLKKTNNLTFNFKQMIDDRTEEGNCIIEYPKKIYCLYNNSKKKIMVSNGKSLVIKNQTNNQYYIYPLKKTPLELILDKNYLINQIKNLEGRIALITGGARGIGFPALSWIGFPIAFLIRFVQKFLFAPIIGLLSPCCTNHIVDSGSIAVLEFVFPS